MKTYHFPISPQLIALAEHAETHHHHQRKSYTGPGWGTREEKPSKPALMLVKDEGCYLMSCFVAEGAPDSARLHTAPSEGERPRLVVVYAQGARPEDGHIGGDDFGEDLVGLPAMILERKTGTVFVTITGKHIEFGVS